MKYKVGDKVKGTNENKYSITNNKMSEAVITKIYGKENMEIKILKHTSMPDKIGNRYDVETKYFELIEPHKFTKSDLKDNHIVLLREGIWGVVRKDNKMSFLERSSEGSIGLNIAGYEENMTWNFRGYDRRDIFDIMEVYEFDKLIWKREEKPVDILDKKEKKYLKQVIRPFKKDITTIRKGGSEFNEYIELNCKDDISMLPNFKSGTMYKNMKRGKYYTLEELGLDGK